MNRTMLKSKIHRATVTGSDLHYVGSITVDADLLEAADILEHELVHVLDVDNGARFETYTIAGARGSGEIKINGAAARLVHTGDTVIVISYASYDESELETLRAEGRARERGQRDHHGGRRRRGAAVMSARPAGHTPPRRAPARKRKAVTLSTLGEKKALGEPIVMVTAYDYPSAQVAEDAGVDVVLVGDSGAMTVLGYPSTVPVSIDEMLMLAAAVRRGLTTPLLVGDLPFGSYEASNEQADRDRPAVRQGGRLRRRQARARRHVRRARARRSSTPASR